MALDPAFERLRESLGRVGEAPATETFLDETAPLMRELLRSDAVFGWLLAQLQEVSSDPLARPGGFTGDPKTVFVVPEGRLSLQAVSSVEDAELMASLTMW